MPKRSPYDPVVARAFFEQHYPGEIFSDRQVKRYYPKARRAVDAGEEPPSKRELEGHGYDIKPRFQEYDSATRARAHWVIKRPPKMEATAQQYLALAIEADNADEGDIAEELYYGLAHNPELQFSQAQLKALAKKAGLPINYRPTPTDPYARTYVFIFTGYARRGSKGAGPQVMRGKWDERDWLYWLAHFPDENAVQLANRMIATTENRYEMVDVSAVAVPMFYETNVEYL